MKFFEVVGDDLGGVNAVVGELVGSAKCQRFDASKDSASSIVTAVSTRSLFEPSKVVVVTGCHKFPVASARELVRVSADNVVVFTGESGLNAAVRKVLPGLDSRVLKVPSSRFAEGWVCELVETYGVQVEEGVVSLAAGVAHTGAGAWRVRSLLMLCAATGSVVSVGLAEEFLSGLGEVPSVWQAGVEVGVGNVSGALVGSDVEPVAVLSSAAGRLGRIWLVLEVGVSDAAEVLGVSEGSLKFLMRGVSADVDSAAVAYRILVDASVRCREVSGVLERRAVTSCALSQAAVVMSI